MLADSVPVEDSLPGLQAATFSLCPHMVRGRGAQGGVSSYKGISPIHEGSTLMTYLEASPPNISRWGLGLQHMNFQEWGET